MEAVCQKTFFLPLNHHPLSPLTSCSVCFSVQTFQFPCQFIRGPSTRLEFLQEIHEIYKLISNKSGYNHGFGQCAVPENIHTLPTEGIGISWEVGGSMRPKNLKKCMQLHWNFLRGGEVLEKIPSVGEVWISSGTTQ